MSAFRLFMHNYIRRPISNWRIMRMWLAAEGEPDRPNFCPQAGVITREDVKWAQGAIARHRSAQS